MDVSIQHFQQAAEAAVRSAALRLSPDGTAVRVRSGRVARCVAGLHAARNREVARAFAESLRSRYGNDVAGAVLRDCSYERFETRGKALRVRRVRRILAGAEDRLQRIQGLKPRAYSKLQQRVAERFPGEHAIVLHIKPQRTMAALRAEVFRTDCRGAGHMADSQIEEIVTRVIDRELDTARDTVLRGVERLGAGRRDSIFGRALAAAADSSVVPIDPRGLTGDAVGSLNARLRSEILAEPFSMDEPVPDAVLEKTARTVAREFVLQRELACRAFLEGAGGAAMAPAVTERIAHDSIPAPLAAAMGKSHARVLGSMASLGRRLDGPLLREALSELMSAMGQVVEDARAVGDPDRGAAVLRNCWRVLLACSASPGGGLAGRVFERLAPETSLLRAVAEGADWFDREFGRANLLSSMLRTLFEAAGETPRVNDAAPALGRRGPEALQDEAITVLRDLGIPIPAPRRIGVQNDAVRLTGEALAQIQARLAGQAERLTNGKLSRGVAPDSLEDFRHCSFSVERRPLARGTRNAVEALRTVCTGQGGRLNEGLLQTVSALTNKATFEAVDSVCFDRRRPDRALLGGRPSIVCFTGPGFDLSRDDRGDVIVRAQRKAEIWNYAIGRPDGSVHSVPMAPGRSKFDIALRLRVDAASCEPSVEAVDLGYALSPAEIEGRAAEPAEAPFGVRLPANFDRAGAVSRLDQEIMWQREEIYRAEHVEPRSRKRIRRMQAELSARELSRMELAAGRDPRVALRAAVEQSGARYGDSHHRTRAHVDTLDYFENAGVFASGEAQARNVPAAADTSGVLAEWRARLRAVQAASAALDPRSQAERERAEVFADAEAFMQQAIVELSSGRDPRPELLRHAAELEGRPLSDGAGAAGEASMLRTMAREYEQLP